MKPRVYVIQENRKIDISPAEEFGEVKVLLPSGDANYQVEDTFERLERQLSDFNPDEDYVLLTGDPAAIFMAGALISERLYDLESGHRFINILKWNRRTSRYLSLRTPVFSTEEQ